MERDQPLDRWMEGQGCSPIEGLPIGEGMSDQAVASARMIGEIFVERGLVTRAQLDEALALQTRDGGLIGEILVSSFGVSRVELATVLAEQWRRSTSGSRRAERTPMVEADEPNVDGAAEPRRRSGATSDRGDLRRHRARSARSDLDRALETQRETGERLGEILVAQGAIGRLGAGERARRAVVGAAGDPATAAEAAAALAGDSRAGRRGRAGSRRCRASRCRVDRAGRRWRTPWASSTVASPSSLAGSCPTSTPFDAEASTLATRLEGSTPGSRRRSATHALVELSESLRRLQGELDETRSGLAERSGLQDELSAIRSRLDELSGDGGRPRRPRPGGGEAGRALERGRGSRGARAGRVEGGGGCGGGGGS